MMHPNTYVKQVSKEIGLGVFASEDIKIGSIIYIQDEFEIVVSPEQFKTMNRDLQTVIDKYTYTDANGYRILSWDHGKYVNHCCYPNTISTGYGFEIAIKNIKKDEQITDDYRLFNLQYEMDLSCCKTNCKKKLRINDFDENVDKWDQDIKNALKHFQHTPQPLLAQMNSKDYEELCEYFRNEEAYKSVAGLRQGGVKNAAQLQALCV